MRSHTLSGSLTSNHQPAQLAQLVVGWCCHREILNVFITFFVAWHSFQYCIKIQDDFLFCLFLSSASTGALDVEMYHCNPIYDYESYYSSLLCHTELLHNIKNDCSANRGDASPMKCYQRYCIGPSASQVHQLRQIRTPWKCLIIMRCGCFKNLFSVCSHSGSPYGTCVDPRGLSPSFFLNLFGFEWRRSGSDGAQISWQYIYPPLLPYFPTTSAFKRSSRSLKATHTITNGATTV